MKIAIAMNATIFLFNEFNLFKQLINFKLKHLILQKNEEKKCKTSS